MSTYQRYIICAGARDGRHAQGSSPSEALDDWFEKYGEPPPRNVRPVIGPRERKLCQIVDVGFSYADAKLMQSRWSPGGVA